MKTRFRTATIVLALGLLGGIGAIPGVILFKDFINPEKLETGIIVLLVLFSLLFVAGIFGLIRYTLQVDIDMTANRISFHYPFRFQKFQYKAREMVGFRYKYLHGRVNYKSLKFRTSDKRTFSISDFETGNLRELESFSLKHFDLRAGKEFKKLTDNEQKTEREISREFDYDQAKDIRFYLGGLTLLLTGIIFALTFQILSDHVTKPKGISITIGVLLIIDILIIKRFIKVHERVKKLHNGAN